MDDVVGLGNVGDVDCCFVVFGIYYLEFVIM